MAVIHASLLCELLPSTPQNLVSVVWSRHLHPHTSLFTQYPRYRYWRKSWTMTSWPMGKYFSGPDADESWGMGWYGPRWSRREASFLWLFALKLPSCILYALTRQRGLVKMSGQRRHRPLPYSHSFIRLGVYESPTAKMLRRGAKFVLVPTQEKSTKMEPTASLWASLKWVDCKGVCVCCWGAGHRNTLLFGVTMPMETPLIPSRAYRRVPWGPEHARGHELR